MPAEHVRFVHRGAARLCVDRLLALVLIAMLLLGTGCAGPGQQSGDVAPADAEATSTKQDDESSGEESTSAALGRDNGDAALDVWADECLDRRGDITVYAISELKGGQLNALLQEQDYAWNERSQIWLKEDGSASVIACNAEGEHLSAEEMSALLEGSSEEAVSYRIVTSGYNSLKKTFEGLAQKVMTCEDVAYTEDGAVGIVSGPSTRRSLVLVSKSNDVYVVTVFGEGAIAAGLLDKEAGTTVAKNIDGAFEALSGRAPGTEE